MTFFMRQRRLLFLKGAALFFGFAGHAAGAPGPGAGLEPAVFLAADHAGDRVVVVGERGMIRFSDDRAASWRAAAVPVDVTLTAVGFATPKVGWAAGHEGVLLKTVDGGASWRVVRGSSEPYSRKDEDLGSFYNERAPLFDILVLDQSNVWAVGGYGVALRSEDGGEHWTSVPVEGKSDFHLYSLVRDRDGDLWAAGEVGALYRSHDGGTTWRGSPRLSRGSHFGGLTADNGAVLLFGIRGSVLFRSPQGRWKTLTGLPPRSLYAGVRSGDGRFLLGGAGGSLIVVDPFTGAAETRELPEKRDIYGLLTLDEDRVLILCDGEALTSSFADLVGKVRP